MSNLSHRHIIILLIILKVGALILGVAAYLYWRPDMEDLNRWREWVVHFLNSIPAPVYFLAFVILPAFGAPLTLFYLTALPVFGTAHPLLGLSLAWLALTLNMIGTHYLARGVFHPAIEWMIRHRNLKIPKLSPRNEWKIVLATRVSPLPFAIQNYLLALGHSRWRFYLGLSLPIQACIGTAVMLVGESILKGGLGYALLAIFVFLIINLALQGLRKKLTTEPIEPVQ
jgi:uncharacterized membrane protein YdjX (TVP38/TMEM64 family)